MKGVTLLKTDQTTKQHLNEDEWLDITTQLAEILDFLSEVINSQDEAKTQACKQTCTPIFRNISLKLLEVSAEAKNKAGKPDEIKN